MRKIGEVKVFTRILMAITLSIHIVSCRAKVRPKKTSEKGRVFTDDAFCVMKDRLRLSFVPPRANSRSAGHSGIYSECPYKNRDDRCGKNGMKYPNL